MKFWNLDVIWVVRDVVLQVWLFDWLLLNLGWNTKKKEAIRVWGRHLQTYLDELNKTISNIELISQITDSVLFNSHLWSLNPHSFVAYFAFLCWLFFRLRNFLACRNACFQPTGAITFFHEKKFKWRRIYTSSLCSLALYEYKFTIKLGSKTLMKPSNEEERTV